MLRLIIPAKNLLVISETKPSSKIMKYIVSDIFFYSKYFKINYRSQLKIICYGKIETTAVTRPAAKNIYMFIPERV